MAIETKAVNLPCDQAAEEAVIGSMFIDPDNINTVASFLKAADFYTVKLGWIFDALVRRQETADLVTVSADLSAASLLNEVGGEAYLTSIMASVPTALNLMAYAKIVRDLSIRRETIAYATDTVQRAMDCDTPLSDSLGPISDKLTRITRANAGINLKARDKGEAFEMIMLAKNSPDGITGHKTGYAESDKRMRGLRSQLRVLGGEPQTGKTSLAINEALNMMRGGNPIPVGFISLETYHAEIELYMTSILLQQDFSGRVPISDELVDMSLDTLNKLEKKPFKLYTHEDGPATPHALLAIVDEWIKDGVKVIYIDNMTNVEWQGDAKSLRLDITSFVTALKGRCSKHQVHITILAHINRDGSKQKEPTNSNLAESAGLERGADIVDLLWRDDDEVLKDGKGKPYVMVRRKQSKCRGGMNGRSLHWFYFGEYRHVEAPVVTRTIG